MARIHLRRAGNKLLTFRLGIIDTDFSDALKMVNINRLDTLDDVVEPANPKDGQTLNYDKTTDKYVVGDIKLDGGDF